MKNYLVGYGSLINSESQKVTGSTGISTPVLLKDHRRSWSVVYNDLKFCALGVQSEKGSAVNAVLFEVQDLPAFDRREHGYHRVQLSSDLFEAWLPGDSIPDDGAVWIYLADDSQKGEASEKFLIWQSYIDVILLGCLSVGESFADYFMQHTRGLKRHFWFDDRADSQYLRGLKQYNAQAVDDFLRKHLV